MVSASSLCPSSRLPVSYPWVLLMFKQAASKAGIGELGAHSLRHSHRSWLDAVGTPIAVQQKLMRHSDIRTTMNIYGGVEQNAQLLQVDSYFANLLFDCGFVFTKQAQKTGIDFQFPSEAGNFGGSFSWKFRRNQLGYRVSASVPMVANCSQMGTCAVSHCLAGTLFSNCGCFRLGFHQSLVAGALGETALEHLIVRVSKAFVSAQRVLSALYVALQILVSRLRNASIYHGIATSERAFFTHHGAHPPEHQAPSYSGLFPGRVFQPLSAI